MCGIVGYLGEKNTKEILLEGLKELEYRGYDSAGIAILQNGEFSKSCLKRPIWYAYKKVGKGLIKVLKVFAKKGWGVRGELCGNVHKKYFFLRRLVF